MTEEIKKPQAITLIDVAAEVTRARAKFPSSRFLLTALMEEVGELAKAVLQKRPKDECRREAMQVACVAIRIMEEGCPEFDGLTDEESKP
jgi:NTP pyrophosphatase (non-canonical NTP hydrolase)